MQNIQLSIRDNVAIIQLDRGRANPLNTAMIDELTACIHEIENRADVSGLIITGKDGFFSAGIDLIEVYHYDHKQSLHFWNSFLKMQLTLAAFKKPYVAAITGHSPAGGCIIALCADYRVMAQGNYIIGLNEVPVGITVPASVYYLYSFWLGKRKAYQYLLEGRLLKSEEAFQCGLIDKCVDMGDVMAAAEKKIREYISLPANTWQQSKLNLRHELIEHLNNDMDKILNDMLHQWWSPETRQALLNAVEKLKLSSVKK